MPGSCRGCPGQGTGFHDHYISSVGLCVASGCVREDLLVYGARAPVAAAAGGRLAPGRPRLHPPRHVTTTALPAVTVHVYSPRLDWVGQYRLGSDGVVLREVRPGRNELTEQLIADGALEHVLERF